MDESKPLEPGSEESRPCSPAAAARDQKDLDAPRCSPRRRSKTKRGRKRASHLHKNNNNPHHRPCSPRRCTRTRAPSAPRAGPAPLPTTPYGRLLRPPAAEMLRGHARLAIRRQGLTLVNFSTFRGIGGTFGCCLQGNQGVSGGISGQLGVLFVPGTAQVELRCGRV